MITMIAGAMQALKVGDPRDLATDVGPVIDEDAKKAARRASGVARQECAKICRLELPNETAHGSFVAPALYEIIRLSELNRENFGPILHVIRFPGDGLSKVVDRSTAAGYGLTLGLQSRIDTVRDYVEEHARVGNFYVNRNQIGAVVESQPFGGEGLERDRSEGRRAALCCTLRDRASDLHRHDRCGRQRLPDGGDRGMSSCSVRDVSMYFALILM